MQIKYTLIMIKKITLSLLLAILIPVVSFAKPFSVPAPQSDNKWYFEEIGYSETDDQLIHLSLGLADGIIISDKVMLAYDEPMTVDAINHMFSELPSEELKKTFEAFGDGKIIDATSFFKHFKSRMDHFAQKFNPYFKAPLTLANPVEKRWVFMSDPSFDVELTVQSMLFMKTLKKQDQYAYRLDMQGEELESYKKVMTNKVASMEEGLKKYGVQLPKIYDAKMTSVEQIIDDIIATDLLMKLQWNSIKDATEKATGMETKIFAPGEVPLSIFVRDFFSTFEEKFIMSNFGFAFDRSFHGQALVKTVLKTVGNESEPVNPGYAIEGGDFVVDHHRGLIWVGYDNGNMTSNPLVKQDLSSGLNLPGDKIITLEKQYGESLPNHLDMFFTPIDHFVLYYPGAFNASNLAKIKEHVQTEDLIELSAQDVAKGTANLLKIGKHLIMSNCPDALKTKLESAGYDIQIVDVSLFLQNGWNGGIHCMTNDVEFKN